MHFPNRRKKETSDSAVSEFPFFIIFKKSLPVKLSLIEQMLQDDADKFFRLAFRQNG